MTQDNGTTATAHDTTPRAGVEKFFSTDHLPDVNLDALLDIAGHVTLKGVRHEVLNIDGAGVQAVQQAVRDKKTGDLLDIYLSIVKQVLPTLGDAARATLTVKQITAIMAICTQNADAIEALEKNVERSTVAPKTRRARGGKRQG